MFVQVFQSDISYIAVYVVSACVTFPLAGIVKPHLEFPEWTLPILMYQDLGTAPGLKDALACCGHRICIRLLCDWSPAVLIRFNIYFTTLRSGSRHFQNVW
ncbi:unnamed protein product [Prorocentrum cordatum]|uniref:Uncharacterized protein n=1 Tax=Prorocentrum cordatum TaxID=2364126 RepID=A0ABN9PR87_9DINO|nr:unnamed protein product [Polarella glacialis]